MKENNTASGEMTEGQLFGGPQDGRDILVALCNGLPPAWIIKPGGRYLADGFLSTGEVRYTLEGWRGFLRSI